MVVVESGMVVVVVVPKLMVVLQLMMMKVMVVADCFQSHSPPLSGEPSADLDFAAPVLSSSFSWFAIPLHRPAACAGVWRRSPSVPDLWEVPFWIGSFLHQKSPFVCNIRMDGEPNTVENARAKQDYNHFP